MMRIKKGFNLREICGEQIIVAEGRENIDFSRIISLNESAALLWKNVIGVDFTVDTLVSVLVENYDVDTDTALKDAAMIVEQWKDVGIIDSF